MATEAELIARIEHLKKARSSGLKTVRDRDREMTYRSDDELQRAIAALEGELTEVQTGSRRRRTFLSSAWKGLS